MTQHIDVLIVDDQPRARQSMRALLATCPSVAAVREATGGLEALAEIEQRLPDVILMDARMPGMDGPEVTRRIKARWPHVKIMMLSMYCEYEDEARSAGADDFMTKGEPPERLLARLEEMADSRPAAPSEVWQ